MLKFLRLPKTIRLLSSVALLLLLALNGYRVLIYFIMYQDLLSGVLLKKALWMGFRFDFRIVAALSLFLLLISLVPEFHFFKRKIGKSIAIAVFALLLTFIFFCYAVDLAHLMITKTRLDIRMVWEIRTHTLIGQEYINTTPWFVLLVFVAIATLLFILYLIWRHTAISKAKQNHSKAMRVYLYIAFAVICLLGIYGRLGKTPLSVESAKFLDNKDAVQLALNPLEAVFDSLAETDAALHK